ncbi:hypothetical protein R1sor_017475 [Riccia sorocarpa]|uniref:Uncharacterized protein n=1 Tax=Riccia sorocarpa TaxID=122646 RepID=A0ABD3I6Y6_9MARC
MRDLFEEEKSSRGTVIAYCKVRLQDEILREVLRSENEKDVGQWIRNIPLANLETSSGYYWVLRNVNDGLNIKVCIEKKEMELTLMHLCPHPKPEYKGDSVPEAVLRRIEEMAGTNIRRGDVYMVLCLEGLVDPERITRAQVKLAKLYVRNVDDQLLSSKT